MIRDHDKYLDTRERELKETLRNRRSAHIEKERAGLERGVYRQTHPNAKAERINFQAYDDEVDYDEDRACTCCDGEGICEDGNDPLVTCPEDAHPCHACHGSGARKDQIIF